jgi:PAS domain S-box-containing protein
MKVLSVDDRDENLYLMETLLRSAGFEVVNAHNGVEALELLDGTHFDLIISDVLMPQMDGFQLCRELRSRPAYAQTPFVFYSGNYTDPKDAELARRVGATRYLVKPLEPAHLISLLTEICDQHLSFPVPAPVAQQDEGEFLKSHNERLFEKLGEKVEENSLITERLQRSYEDKVREITERLNAEQSLREQAHILANSHEAIIVTDGESVVRHWNRGAERLYGWTAAEAIGRREWELYAHMPYISPLRKLTDKGAFEAEYRHVTKDSRELIVQGRFTPVEDREGRTTGVMAFYADITEKKQLEEQFLRAQRLESIGILAGGVAHDLNNILAPILLAIPVVRMRVQDKQGLQLLDTMEASATRGAQIVRQILNFSRGLRSEKGLMQPRHLLKEIAEIMQETFPRNISIDADIPRSLHGINGDGTQLHQVLMNLCVNARDAMPRGGTLTLKAENIELGEAELSGCHDASPGSYVRISVIDTGTGIEPDLIPKLFEPFFTTKEVGKGTGLGLSTVRSIVDQHKGFVTVSSRLGEGSCFSVHLPAVEKARELEPVERQELPRGQGERILVIDDEFAIRHICEELLGAHGYEVVSAESGQQALGLLREQLEYIAAVITDISMPIMSGAEFIPLARGLKPSLKIIAMSGTLPASDNKSPAGIIADAFLTKPFAAAHLLRTVQEVLDD